MTDVLPTSSGQEQGERDREADLARAKREMAGPVPLIESSPDCTVTLLRGLAYEGTRHTQAEVRELTGTDEEALAKFKRPEEAFDAILTYGVVRIGPLMLADMPIPERQGHLRNLLIGERDLLFLAIASVTYGDERTYPVTCDKCSREQDMTLNLFEEFPPKKVDLDASYEFTTSKGLKLEYRLATGADQMEVLAKGANVNPAEINTLMISQCILSIDGGMVVDPLNFARGLPLRDRQALLTVLVDRQPSVDLRATYECIGCGEERRIALGWMDLFRP